LSSLGTNLFNVKGPQVSEPLWSKKCVNEIIFKSILTEKTEDMILLSLGPTCKFIIDFSCISLCSGEFL